MSNRDEMKNTLTILMAGGKGERLYPLTKARAKPSVRFGGIYRIVDFTLSNCLNSDIRRIYVSDSISIPVSRSPHTTGMERVQS